MPGAQLTYVDKAQSLKRDQLETAKSEGKGDALSTKQRTLLPFQSTK